MAESIRLHHSTLRSAPGSRLTYVVELATQPMPPGHSRPCYACSQPGNPLVHQFKSIHLRLDENGDVFVAPGILSLLRTVPTMAGLEVAPGRNAPPQVVGAVEQAQQEVVLPTGIRWVPAVPAPLAVERMRAPFQPYVEAVREKQDREVTAKRVEKSSTFILGRRK